MVTELVRNIITKLSRAALRPSKAGAAAVWTATTGRPIGADDDSRWHAQE